RGRLLRLGVHARRRAHGASDARRGRLRRAARGSGARRAVLDARARRAAARRGARAGSRRVRSAPVAAERLAARYDAVRRATERIAEPLSAEDCAAQSMPDASPIRWHLAHTSWFFETFVLARADAGYRRFDTRFDFLFNSYYNAIGERVARPMRGKMTRPDLGEVLEYRAHVDRAVARLLEREAPPAL